MKKWIFTTLLSAVVILSQAQSGALKKANRFYSNLSFAAAIDAYKNVLDKDSTNTEAQHKLADSYYRIGQLQNAEPVYAKLKAAGALTVEEKFNYAQSLKSKSKYDEADAVMAEFSAAKPDDNRAKNYAKGKKTITKLRQATAGAEVINVQNVNTPFTDFGAVYFKNQIVFITNGQSGKSIRRIHSWNNEPFLNVYIADADAKGKLSNATKFRDNINTKFHEGPVCFSAAGDVMYFTRNNYFNKSFGKDNQGVNNLKIFRTKLEDSVWTSEETLPFNSDNYSTGHPSLSADGKYLYFVSDMPGGQGGTDIWRAELSTDGSLGSPQNLGATINTEGNEMFPFIHPDGTLFYASNGHAGFGGLDVFSSSEGKTGFTAPENLGKAINSEGDDFAFVCDANQQFGYLSSNRMGGKGGDDIYFVQLNAPLRQNYTIEGIAINALTKQPLVNTAIVLTDETGAVLGELVTDASGAYSFPAEADKKYILNGTKESFLPAKESFTASNLSADNPILKKDLSLNEFTATNVVVKVIDKKTGESVDAKVTAKVNTTLLPLTATNKKYAGQLTNQRIGETYLVEASAKADGYIDGAEVAKGNITKDGIIEVVIELTHLELGLDLGQVIGVNPIYFDKDKSDIRPDAALELQKIIDAMQQYPNLEIELGSHTDCRASKSYNQSLSDRRAKASAAYIVKAGIASTRIKGKGYGESQLVNQCECEGARTSPCTEEEHQMNRRTIFKIVKM